MPRTESNSTTPDGQAESVESLSSAGEIVRDVDDIQCAIEEPPEGYTSLRRGELKW